MSDCVIAVDGPAASGKSTVSRRVAAELGHVYVDSGALYRGVTWQALRQGVAPDDAAGLGRMLAAVDAAFFIENGAVEFAIDGVRPGQELRSKPVREAVSPVAAVPQVREFVTGRLRAMRRFGPLVMEGRDIGTVVFPDAAFKFFLDASADERARRRQGDLAARNEPSALAQVRDALGARDARDSTRSTAPLKAAADAVVIDSTRMGIDEVVRLIVRTVRAGVR